ncbi:isoprenylcysteine carboxylmethyltransferase family protein [Herbiconiux sp. KACC 21604]|uniref:methyltransferase family protein n=1 Tax=unclassified Herbiconiux TaxID=2618217 RepID=UPI00352FCD8B|nr:isoprenylcysteine carboxylmethyltransferase family protein [Herbiconiux sp. KACC 21604]
MREATLGILDPVAVAALDIPLFVVASALAATPLRIARGVSLVVAAWTALVTLALALLATLGGGAGWGVLIMVAATGGSLVAATALMLGRVPTEWIVTGPFAFRPADARRGPAVNLAVTAAQIVVFWGVFFVVIPLVITALEHRWRVGLPLAALGVVTPPVVTTAVTVIGAVVFVVAGALGLWSAAIMAVQGGGTPLPSEMANRLVVVGPYRWVRNPMAVAGIVQGVAVGLLLGSWLVVAYALAGSLLWNLVVRPYEEADLEERFGDDFRRYRDAVRCWVPSAHPYR